MPAQVKILPPVQLPANGITDTKLKIWFDQLVSYLEQDDNNSLFLEGGLYSTWTAAEENPLRILAVDPAHNGGVLATRSNNSVHFLPS